MNKLFFIFTLITVPFISVNASALKIYNYKCPIDAQYSAEVSLLAANNPSISLFFNKTKYATCFYYKGLDSSAANPRAVHSNGHLALKQEKCEFYYDKYKDKINLRADVKFIQADKKNASSFLSLIKDQEPITCHAN